MCQIAKQKFPRAMLLGGLSVNLNHLKMVKVKVKPTKKKGVGALCEIRREQRSTKMAIARIHIAQ